MESYCPIQGKAMGGCTGAGAIKMEKTREFGAKFMMDTMTDLRNEEEELHLKCSYLLGSQKETGWQGGSVEECVLDDELRLEYFELEVPAAPEASGE